MKGLVLKDIYSVKFQLFGGLAIMLLPNFMLMISGGNMGEESEMNSFLSVAIYGMMNYISITLCSSFLLNTLEFDEKSGWAKMQRAMPLSDGQIIGGKLIAMAIVLGILTALSLICNLTGVIFFELPAEPLIALPFIAGFLQTITLSLCFMAGYRFSSKLTMLTYILTELVVAACMIFFVIEIVKESVSETAVRIIAYAAIPVLTAAVTAISFISGKKAVMRDI